MTQSVVLMYRVTIYSGTNHTTLSTTTTSFTIHSLVKGTNYSVVVAAVNIAGISAPSNTIIARTNIDRK